jgi:hypothetical protein
MKINDILELIKKKALAEAKYSPYWPTDALHAVNLLSQSLLEMQLDISDRIRNREDSSTLVALENAIKLGANVVRFLASFRSYTYNDSSQEVQSLEEETKPAEPEETYSIGQMFQSSKGELFFLAQVGPKQVCFIVKHGNRYKEPVAVADPLAVTREELLSIGSEDLTLLPSRKPFIS